MQVNSDQFKEDECSFIDIPTNDNEQQENQQNLYSQDEGNFKINQVKKITNSNHQSNQQELEEKMNQENIETIQQEQIQIEKLKTEVNQWKNEYIKLQSALQDNEKQNEELKSKLQEQNNYFYSEVGKLTKEVDEGYKLKQMENERIAASYQNAQIQMIEEIKKSQIQSQNYFSKIKELQDKVKNLQEKTKLLEQCFKNEQKYKVGLNQVSQQLLDSKKKENQLRLSYSQSQKQFDDQRYECNQLKITAQDQKNQLVLKEQTIIDLQITMKSFQGYQEKYKKLHQELLEALDKNFSLTNENNSLIIEIAHIKNLNHQLEQSKNGLSQLGQDLIDKFQEQKETIFKMTSLISCLKEQKQELFQKNYLLEEQVHQYRLKIKELKSKIQENELKQKSQVEIVSNWEQDLQSQINKQNSETIELQNLISKYNSFTETQENKIKEIVQTHEKQSQELNELQSVQVETKQLKKKNSEQQIEIESLQKDLQNSQQKIKEKDDNLNRQNNSITELKKQIDQQLKEYLELKNQLYETDICKKQQKDLNLKVEQYQYFLQIKNKFQTKEEKDKEVVNQLEELLKPPVPSILLLSGSENSKQTIMKNLFPNQKLTQYFQKNYSENLNSYVIDTEPFEFENIDEREKQISQYKTLFQANPCQIYSLWIAVKFERTDIMKQNIMQIFKHVEKLKIPIILIITDFHLSDNKTDKQQLTEKFQIFQAEILFFNNQEPQQFLIELKDVLSKKINAINYYAFNTIGTMFEDIDPSQQAIIQKQLTEFINLK